MFIKNRQSYVFFTKYLQNKKYNNVKNNIIFFKVSKENNIWSCKLCYCMKAYLKFSFKLNDIKPVKNNTLVKEH